MEKKHPGGRPTKYNPAFHPKLAVLLAGKGLTLPQIAEELGVATSTVNKWQVDHKEFSDALKSGKEGPDDLVERSLFERATGYVNKNATKIFYDSKTGEPVYAPYVEHVVPDVTAQIFWLKNRRPERWREKVEQVHSGNINVTSMTREEAAAEVARLEAQLEKS